MCDLCGVQLRLTLTTIDLGFWTLKVAGDPLLLFSEWRALLDAREGQRGESERCCPHLKAKHSGSEL